MTTFHPSLMLLWAELLVGVTKPECTIRTLVPPSTGVRVKVTTVSSSEP